MSTYPRATTVRLPGRKAGNLFIALVVWAAGVAFTRQALPLDASLGPIAPWIAAVVAQLALSLGQSNLRDRGASAGRWPYVVLVAADIGLNAIGLLITYGQAESAGSAILFTLRAVTTGAELWKVIAVALVGAVVAALPEQMVRDAVGS